jgi:serine/threonine-protein kinase
VTLGTFDYISPEQARDPRSADIRSDIYSLGCTLFFMLAGRPPFPEGTVLQKLLQHQGDEPPDLQEIRPDAPEPVVAVVNTMLAKKPDSRFQTPTELVTALVAVTEQLGIGHPAVVSPLTWTEPRLRGHWVIRNAPWLVPVMLLPLGVLAMERFWRSDEPPPQFSDLQPPVLAAPQEAPPVDVKELRGQP